MDIFTLLDRFNCETKCRRYLEALRFPSGVCCIRCGDTSVVEIKRKGEWKGQWDCRGCGYQFSVTVGTIMHDSHLPLRKWFGAIYLMAKSRKGIAAWRLKELLGIGSYKTAWYLCHRIREAMGNDPFIGPTLVGIVEVDETLIGGRTKGKGAAYKGNKTWVAGAIQRGGQIRLERIPNIKRKTLHGFIARTVKDETEAIYTDELKSYLGVADHNTRHETVKHSEEEWVVGDVHTNSIEGVWSLFKRSIVGTFHKMSVKHLDRYLEEMEWRFNNRKNPHIFRDALLRILNTDRLTYRRLVDGEEVPKAA